MSELPPPVVPPVTRNRWAVPALALGVAALAAGFLVGVFLLRIHPLVGFAVVVLLGGVALGVGIAAIVAASRRQGRGLLLGILGALFGASAAAAVFFGRVIGAEVFGIFWP